MKRPEAIRTVLAIGPDGIARSGFLMQYYHLVNGRYEKNDYLGLRIPGYPDARQSRRKPDTFEMEGVGEFFMCDL